VSSVPRHRAHRVLAVVGLAILGAVLYWVGIDVVIAALARASPAAVATALVAVVISTLLGAWNCYRIAELRTTLSFRSFLPVFWRSWAVGITLPGQVGDFVTTLWQLKGRTADLNFVAGRLIVDKAITLALMLALVALLPAAIGASQPAMSVMLLIGLGVGIAVLVALIARWRRHPTSLGRSRLGARAVSVLTATRVPAHLIVHNIVVTAAKLLATGVVYWSIISSIVPAAPSFTVTTIISQSAGLVAYVPISFNGIGTVELSGIALFGVVGVKPASVLSAYVAIRAITLAVAWLPLGAVAMLPVSYEKR
jgi:uncharacterized membrane protein YbhN (UPF0104 family)